MDFLFLNFQGMFSYGWEPIVFYFLYSFVFIIISFVIFLLFAWRFYSIDIKIQDDVFRKLWILFLFILLFSIFILCFWANLEYNIISQIIWIFSDAWRYDDEFWNYYKIISNIFFILKYGCFGFLLYKIYRNIIVNNFTTSKIIVSYFLMIIAIILTFSSIILFFVSMASLCGNSCSGVGKGIWILFSSYYLLLIILIITFVFIFRIWSTKNLIKNISTESQNS